MKNLLHVVSIVLILITATLVSITIVAGYPMPLLLMILIVFTVTISSISISVSLSDIFEKIDKDIKEYLLESEEKTLEVKNPYQSTIDDWFPDQKY